MSATDPDPADTVTASVGDPEATAVEDHPAATAGDADAPMSMSAGSAAVLAAHPTPREDRIGTCCEDYELDGCRFEECPEACYLNGPCLIDGRIVDALTDLALDELGVDMPLGDMCRPATQRRDYRPSTHRIRTLPVRGNYL